MVQGVVDLATEATGCHACFIYLLEGDRLTIRAASPVFADAVATCRFAVDEGLTGWVARHRTPEFIRDRAMSDPRMKYIPLLQEERFQSMVAVPILARAGRHDRGDRAAHRGAARVPRRHSEAARPHRLVDQRRDRERPAVRPQRRRVDTLTRLSRLAQDVAAATDAGDVGRIVALETRRLLGAGVCQLYRLGDGGSGLALLAGDPEIAAPSTVSPTGLLLAALDGGAANPARARPVARAGRRRPAGRAADGRRRARRAAVRGRTRAPGIQSRGHRGRASDRSPRGDRDQAR